MARTSESALQQEIMAWISQNQYVYLATVDKKQARVRPVVLFMYEDRYFFATFSGDAKVGQISANKWVEVCVPLRESGNTGYIRLTGIARIVTNAVLKAEASERCFFFDEYFHGYDDPDYTLIEFEADFAEYLRPGERTSQTCNLKRHTG
ncbi:MAG TPA: pyridoxamine 5'-phosphate oxidase family protein [Candidatus Syntrophosphaera sp.]|jgi:general stress protein 26|nr:pyridoxamine 5'-phosphate oxidase family protein [Candidatus Cloacimonadota bacterium]HPB43052.1 pyridoxamine 5'-phosphate oxidase family protein [Candidatus Syntrophosphaera sp.]HQG94714.1 pyridoxamine 5'-phosphate oxidase family protein [Candidatus Syntrophosphaera sp.]HQK29821.1 pyridoxamine 5'-phosphate oxidase family protein [Candidatus Syntrophosphaera sp.]HQO67821.1 pyridoxamine 5'-phosphate oxidase family protein [Candidatus Syntrophosphaera sp.]